MTGHYNSYYVCTAVCMYVCISLRMGQYYFGEERHELVVVLTEAGATVLCEGEAEVAVASVAALVVDTLRVDAGVLNARTFVDV